MNPPGNARMTRRTFMRTSAAGAATLATAKAMPSASAMEPASDALAPTLPPYVGAGSNAPVRPFPLHDVTLGDGLFQEKRDRIKAFLRMYDERRFLVLFNNMAGRPNPPGVQVPGGWEDGGQLSGHWAGHYLTALAQAYADQGEQIYKDKLDWMVGELAACQDAITARMDNPPDPGGTEPPPVGRIAGRFGNALRLNGDSSARYVNLPQETAAQIADFTIAAWVNLATTQNWTRLFDFGQNTAVNMFLTPRAGVTGNPPRFAITTSGSGGEQRITGGSALPVGEWVHLAVTLGGSTGTLYVNGQVAGTNPSMTLNAANLGNPGNVWIGRSQYSDPFLDAAVDEFHVFNRALSQADVQSLSDTAAGSTGGGNIAWYRFDESGGTDALDASPNGRAATIVPGVDEDPAGWVPTHPGYLGANPEDLVLRLGPPRFATYGGASGTWAPWYVQHKIVRGLLDAYALTGNAQAFEIARKMSDWAHLALTIGDKNHPDYSGPLTRDDLNFMWDTYIAGEFGGANEPYAEVHALTGDERYLELARFFDNRQSLFEACVDNRDILTVTSETNPGPRRPNRLHANQHIPNYLGYLRIFEQSDDDEYMAAARNFFGMVVPYRRYAIGGTGGNFPGSNNNLEQFQNRGNIANALMQSGAETDTAYNLMRVARNLFFHEPDAAYMDYYERGLVNQILGSRADNDNTNNPQVTYFQPLGPGATRSYGNTGTCCGGSGLESHTKYTEAVYSRSADGSTLWVNLYVPSTLRWTERDFTVTQETDFPRGDQTRLTVDGAGRLTLRLRVPGWVEKGFVVRINGVRQDIAATPGTYVSIQRTWSRGDRVDIAMPFSIRIERSIDRPDTQAIFWGPILMPILGSTGGSFRELTLYRDLKRDGDYTRAAITPAGATPAGDQLFTTRGLNLRPWYIGDTQPHSAYFRRVEPQIVFGSIDSGVPNRKRDDGLPDYDVPVEGVPSPGHDGPTFLDLVWDEAPFATHGDFVGVVARTAADFVRAGTYTDEEKDAIVAAAGRAVNELAP
jgi:uncharacterized protein